MRKSVVILLALPALVLACGACSNVNVEAKDETVPPHEKTFRDEMEGRSPDYRSPRVVELPEPVYPGGASLEGVEGIMMVRVLVDHDGSVLEAEVQQGLHPELDAAALAAARGGTYAPASESGVATDGWLTVPFRYPPPVDEER